MIRIRFLVGLVAAAALVTSCGLDRKNPTEPIPDPQPNPTGSTLTLQVGQTKMIQQYGLEITFDTVCLDNRCPIGAYCFWGGMAIFRLEVGAPGADKLGVIFHEDPDENSPDSTRYVVTEVGKFQINLKTLAPYPNLDSAYTYDDYSVTLTVKPFQAPEGMIGEIVPSQLLTDFLIGNRVDIDSVWVAGNTLTVAVKYGGGCEQHQFAMFMNPTTFAESNPVQANLYLFHNGNNDRCYALVHQQLTFGLNPVIERHFEQYGHDAPIRLNVHDIGDRNWRDAGNAIYWPPSVDCVRIVPGDEQQALIGLE